MTNKEKQKAYNKTYRLKHKEKRNAYSKAYNKAYYLLHREKIKAQAKSYYLKHPEECKAYNKAYLLLHPEKVRAYCKTYYLKHSEKVNAYSKTYQLLHPEKAKASLRAYGQTPKGKTAQQKCYNKRKRQLGFIPLNAYFKGSHGHHVDRERVIYIPSQLHESIGHSLLQDRNMEMINARALEFLKTNALRLFY